MRGKKLLKLKAQAKKFAFKYEGAGADEGVVGKYYPAEDRIPKKGLAPVRNPPKLKASITPGSILILLAGRFRGKRVIFLKQLTSGLLLIAGPYSLNGVPLRRVNQKYVIATETKVDISGVSVASVDDALFKREVKAVKRENKSSVFDSNAEPIKNVVSPERMALQTKIDAELSSSIGKVDMLGAYLKARFTLSKHDKPHAMKF